MWKTTAVLWTSTPTTLQNYFYLYKPRPGVLRPRGPHHKNHRLLLYLRLHRRLHRRLHWWHRKHLPRAPIATPYRPVLDKGKNPEYLQGGYGLPTSGAFESSIRQRDRKPGEARRLRAGINHRSPGRTEVGRHTVGKTRSRKMRRTKPSSRTRVGSGPWN